MVSVDREDLAMIDGPFSDASRGLSESLIRELGSVGVAVEQQRPVPAHAFFPPQTRLKGTNQGGLGRRLLQRWEGSARVRLFHDCSERSSIPLLLLCAASPQPPHICLTIHHSLSRQQHPLQRAFTFACRAARLPHVRYIHSPTLAPGKTARACSTAQEKPS